MLNSAVTVAGVVTSPQSFAISYRPTGVTNVLHADFSTFASAQNVPVVTLKRSMTETGLRETVMTWRPDAFLVVGWYHMIPRTWRDTAPAYGLHASLLPDYSGGAPLVWAMINGESRTGITLFQMDDGVDSGLVVNQAEEPIKKNDTIATLYARIEERGLQLLDKGLPEIANGTANFRAQDESRRRIFPQRSPEDGIIDWNRDAEFIERFIRAQTKPYPGAFTILNGKPLRIWRASIAQRQSGGTAPGAVMQEKRRRYSVSCGKDAIRLLEISYDGLELSGEKLAQLFHSDTFCFDAAPLARTAGT